MRPRATSTNATRGRADHDGAGIPGCAVAEARRGTGSCGTRCFCSRWVRLPCSRSSIASRCRVCETRVWSVLYTDLALILLIGGLLALVGWKMLLLAALPVGAGHHCRRVVVLCAASIRGCLLGEERAVELPGCRAAGELILPTAEGAAVVQRQHRLPSHPPSGPQDSELPVSRPATTRIRRSRSSR